MAEGEAVPAAQVCGKACAIGCDGEATRGVPDSAARRSRSACASLRAHTTQRGSWGQFLKQLASFSGDLSSLTAPSFILSPTCALPRLASLTLQVAMRIQHVYGRGDRGARGLLGIGRDDARGADPRRHALVDPAAQGLLHPSRGPDRLGEEAAQPGARRAVQGQMAGDRQHRRDDARVRAGLASPADQVRWHRHRSS